MGLISKLQINQRPREKALVYGLSCLSNEELIAIILSTGNKNSDALELSQNLIKETGSLNKLFNLSVHELSKFTGIKKVKAIKLKTIFELHKRLQTEGVDSIVKIDNIIDACRIFLKECQGKNQEMLQLMLLDYGNNLISTKVLFLGTDYFVFTNPRMIISTAIKEGAKKIIIAHNHPSKNVNPSNEDIMQTENLKLVLSLVDVELVDHLILSDKKCYSLKNKEIINI